MHLDHVSHGPVRDLIPKIGPLDPAAAVGRILSRHPLDQLDRFFRHRRPSWPLRASVAYVRLRGDHLSVPTQDRVGCNDRRIVPQRLEAQDLAFDGQAAALIVGQNTSLAVYFLAALILGAEVLHQGLLFAVEPPSDDGK